MTDALPFDDPPRRLIGAYPSRLTTWQDCPRRYFWTVLDPQPLAGPWAHYSYGTSVHEALRAWFELPVDERTSERAAELVRERWIDAGYRDTDQSARLRERAAEQAARYVVTQDRAAEPAGLERTVGTTTGVLSVRGRVDRIDRRASDDAAGDELVIVDYKTSRRPPEVDDVKSSLALAMYSAAAERTLRRPCRTVELHHVPTATVVGWTWRPGQRERHLQRADELALECAAAEEQWRAADEPEQVVDALFPVRPGPGCRWCSVRSSCEAGRREGEAARPWDGVDDDAG